MEPQNGSDFTPPEVHLGDKVLWYDNPLNLKEPRLGWVSRRPGVKTICVLTFSESLGGLVEKESVRHASDPGLQENVAWRQCGCWTFHPETDLLKKLGGMMPQIVANLARSSKNKE